MNDKAGFDRKLPSRRDGVRAMALGLLGGLVGLPALVKAAPAAAPAAVPLGDGFVLVNGWVLTVDDLRG
jgi:hypothetical protein